MVLMSAGLGAVPGAFFWGWMADTVGRRKVFILTALNFSIPTGLMALTPDTGGWIYLDDLPVSSSGSACSGLFAVDLPLVQEFVPTLQTRLVGGLRPRCSAARATSAALFLGAFLAPVFWLARPSLSRSAAGADDAPDPRAWVPECARAG